MTGEKARPLRVLVVDDEHTVRRVLSRVVERLGAMPVLATTGHEACSLVDGQDRAFDLILLDVTLPDLDGLLVAERILAARPPRRLVLMSGHVSPDTHARMLALAEPTTMLLKPFGSDVIAPMLRALARED